MVHRGGRVYMPTSTGGNVKMMGTRTIRGGGGNGTVLLNTGGAGVESFSQLAQLLTEQGLDRQIDRHAGRQAGSTTAVGRLVGMVCFACM